MLDAVAVRKSGPDEPEIGVGAAGIGPVELDGLGRYFSVAASAVPFEPCIAGISVAAVESNDSGDAAEG